MGKLTKAQWRVLSALDSGKQLRNFDEVSPQWWVQGQERWNGSSETVYPQTAAFLISRHLVEFCAHWGGQPGILGYRITPAGREALLRSLPRPGDAGETK